MALATVLGFPRIGASRELKKALEAYWQAKIPETALRAEAARLRAHHWALQKNAGQSQIPTNDFSFYDQVLDQSVTFGVIPTRYADLVTHQNISLLDLYFALARGAQKDGFDVPACEMTKWFDTNYHYIVPEFSPGQHFALVGSKPVEEFEEAKAQGLDARPVLIAPVSYLRLGKRTDGGNTLDFLEALLPTFVDLLKRLEAAGATWVQLDEPSLVLDLDTATKQAIQRSYDYLRAHTKLKIFVTTPFGSMGDNLDLALHLPIDALHLDLVRGADQLTLALHTAPKDLILALGVVSGRNIWRNNLSASLGLLNQAAETLGRDRIWVTTSCSLLHVPYDLDRETELEDEFKTWLAFAHQKLNEVALLTKGLNESRASIATELEASDAAALSRQNAKSIHRPSVQERMNENPLEKAGRVLPFAERAPLQAAHLNLPLFPTTTIGSFPQTQDIRKMRADERAGRITPEAYDAFLKDQIRNVITFQNDLDLDVLVHGEFERNDMVEYFGEKLSGFAFTKNGWVQSYGSRCVKPPIIFGDVARPRPMTVDWIQFAQSLTQKPVKGMLTGPVTILQWSFVRDDQPREATAHQIALALQDEVKDLEKAGIAVIQIDEPAFREGLPLRRAAWESYLTWATRAFRLSTTGVKNETQIHTHMCYSEFNDILPWITKLDADVISIETSRSHMELLKAFQTYSYPNAIGPGVYDIHSPRVPDESEIIDLLEAASKLIDKRRLWVNPDCGLKTRGWPEVKAALQNMIDAAHLMRSRARLGEL